jgi:hypothetical protein
MIKPKSGVDTVDICIKVYDPTQQKLIAVYENYMRAAQKLGITPKILYHRIIFKKRVFSPAFNLEIAVRSAGKKEGDDKLIEETFKYGKLKEKEEK